MIDLIPANNSTTASLELNVWSFNTIETAGDVDWFKITLAEGKYEINLSGDTEYGAQLGDPKLYLYNAEGTLFLTSDDGGSGKNSYIHLDTIGGIYYVAASGYNNWKGDYGISVSYGMTALNIGQVYTNRLDNSNHTRGTLVYLNEGEQYTISATTNYKQGSALQAFDLSVKDFSGGGSAYVYDDQPGTGTATVYFIAPKSSLYIVDVYSAGTGYYDLSVVTAAPETNDRPVGGNATVAAQEDIAYTFTTSSFPFSDADGEAFGGIVIVGLPTMGSLTLDGEAVSIGKIVPAGMFAGLKYTPPANASGSASFNYEVYADGPWYLWGFGNRSVERETTAHTFTFNISSVNDAPVIQSGGGGTAFQLAVDENALSATTVIATDVDGTPSYSILGADVGRFSIDAATGVLTFKAPPNFEAPGDAGRDNTYDVTVVASDGVLSDAQALSIVVQNVTDNTVTGTGGGDRIDSSHGVKGKHSSNKDDYIDAKKGNDKVSGLAGDDTLVGGADKDTLDGGAGYDRLDGGDSADRFVFSAKLDVAGVDTIVKFEHDKDKVALDDKVFKAIGSSLSADEFYAKAGAVAAKDKGDHVIYNKTTGDLYYDKDGKGGAAAVHFATLANHPANLDNGDFTIV